MVTIIGIGTRADEWTRRAEEKIRASERVYLRTARTKAGKAAAKAFPHAVALDELYEKATDFSDWTEKVCASLTEGGDAVYLTDGDGFGDSCAAALEAKGVEVEYYGGVAPYATRRATAGELRMTATEAARLQPYLDTAVGVCLTEVDDAPLAGECKLWLMSYYGDETPVAMYIGGKLLNVPLCEIDRQRGYGYDCELRLAPAESLHKDRYCFGDLRRIMRRLTAPDGCPWDKAQTHESIRINMIEEAYEAVDAIDGGDLDAQIEEMGDVLLQTVLHADIARRHGEYDMPEVLDTLCRKLVHRHTHIFGSNHASDAAEALVHWEAAKSQEKSYISTADKLQRLPESFPALLAAAKVYGKLVKAGVKPDEAALAKADMPGDERQCAARLFWEVAAMREKGIDAEVALAHLVAALKREFATAEKSGDTADFLGKLCK